MAVHVSRPRSDLEGLDDLAPLWKELHRHHRATAEYEDLVADPEVSWTRRRAWYGRLLASGASYATASGDEGGLIGYVMVAFEDRPDDPFDVHGGIAEVVTVVVSPGHRSAGVGRALLEAAEKIARGCRFDTVKIAVMSGNIRDCVQRSRWRRAHRFSPTGDIGSGASTAVVNPRPTTCPTTFGCLTLSSATPTRM
jgi:GNAT superfamily N-acetyltransferase